MSTNTKPRICEVLGVEVGERFTIDGYPTDYGQVQVCEDRKVRRVLSRDLSEVFGEFGHKIGSNALYYLLSHPDCIIRQPRFTADEVADAIFLRKVLYAEWIARNLNRDDLFVFESKPWITNGHWSGVGTKINPSLFQSICPGQSVEIGAVVELKGVHNDT